MIDSCVGNHKPRPTRALAHDDPIATRKISRQAVQRERYRFVIARFTYRPRRVEHAVENGQWVPTFPKARYVSLTATALLTKRQKDDPAACPWITDLCSDRGATSRRYVKSAHASRSRDAHPTPGHTIDHYSVQVGKPGVDAHYRRHDPLAAASPLPRTGHESDYDSSSGTVAAGIARSLLRYAYAVLHGAPSLASTGRVVSWVMRSKSLIRSPAHASGLVHGIVGDELCAVDVTCASETAKTTRLAISSGVPRAYRACPDCSTKAIARARRPRD